MIPFGQDDLSSFSMMDLFRQETSTQIAVLVEGLLILEREPNDKTQFETLMRAAHSLKGAARLVSRDEAVRVGHAIEDCFVEAQNGKLTLTTGHIDVLLKGTDLLLAIADQPDELPEDAKMALDSEVDRFLAALASPPVVEALPVYTPAPAEAAPPAAQTTDLAESPVATAPIENTATATAAVPSVPAEEPGRSFSSPRAAAADSGGRSVVRVSAHNIDRLIGLAGESVIATRWLGSFSKDLIALKRLHSALSTAQYQLNESLVGIDCDERVLAQASEIRDKEAAIRQILSDRLEDLEVIERRLNNLSTNLYHSVLDCRMRPFADGVQGLSRMVRDVARGLGKDVNFEILGENTAVDRDVLELIEAPLGHLLRNAVDHGVETPEERVRTGKPATGNIRLEARHLAGLLIVTVEDDGKGIDLDALRVVLVEKKLVTSVMAESLNEQELFEFLFLPGFTMKTEVTDVSGRGVGLDVVQTMVREIGGTITVGSQPQGGTKFDLQLPLTLSVMRALLFEVSGETYALPLARAISVLKLPRTQLQTTEGRQHFLMGERQVGLVMAHQVLGLAAPVAASEDVAVVVIGDANNQYGVIVDRFIDERELVVRPLDPRLGKVQNIHAAALMPDQSPVLILDTEDFINSMRRLISGGELAQVSQQKDINPDEHRKRVLVVDDSLTVRELERKLIAGRGYVVEVAIDGMEAWNAVRTGHYDLVVTDVDMPRMDGIKLVGLIKNDIRLKALPVMIVSYKDREEDHRRGLEAGADYYLTKASFHDETLLTAVEDLIGPATS